MLTAVIDCLFTQNFKHKKNFILKKIVSQARKPDFNIFAISSFDDRFCTN